MRTFATYTARKEPRFSRVSTHRESVVSRLQASKPKIRLASEIAYQPSMYESSRPFASRVRIRRLLRPRCNARVCFAVKAITLSSRSKQVRDLKEQRRRPRRHL